LLAWLRDTVATEKRIAAVDLDLFSVTDDVDSAVEFILRVNRAD
jgi:hypothetical protein